jgi:predicted DNA-binding WGR domain protein
MASATNDNDESTTISFGCDYAKSSNAKCHGKYCSNEISKGTLRLSRLIPNPFIPQSSTREEQLMPVYYHLDCFINYLRSGSENKKRVENVENDLQGFNELKKADQNKLQKLFGYEEKLQGKLSETSTTAHTTYLEHDQDKKYWQISIDNKSTKTKYGLLNEPDSNAIILYKDFSTQSEAQKYVDKKTQEKLKHGYTVKKQTGATPPPAAAAQKTKQSTASAKTTAQKRKQPTTSAKTTPAKRAKKQEATSTTKTVATRKQPTRSASKTAK